MYQMKCRKNNLAMRQFLIILVNEETVTKLEIKPHTTRIIANKKWYQFLELAVFISQ